MKARPNRRPGAMIRNALHLGFGQVATTVLAIVLNAMMARKLDTHDFGLLFLVNSIAAFAYVIINWGFEALMIRGIAREPQRSGEFFGSALALRLAAALVACGAVFVVTWILGYDLTTRVLSGISILLLLPQYVTMSVGWVFRGHERMDRDAQINVALKILVFVFSAGVLALGGGVLQLLLAVTLASLVTLILAVHFYRQLGLPGFSVSRATMRDMVQGGLPIFIMSVAGAVQQVTSANILYKLATPTVVGWFGAAYAIVGTLSAPANILGLVAFPRLSAQADNPAEFRRTFETFFRPLFLLAVLGGVGTYVFAEVPVALIYGLTKFAPTADNLRAYAPVMFLLYIDVYLGNAILAKGVHHRQGVARLVAAAIAIALALLLVPICQDHFGNGGLGVMFALLGGEVATFLFSLYLIGNVVDGVVATDAARGLLAGIGTLVLFHFLPTFTPFLAIPLLMLVFAGLALLTGALRRNDVDILRASFRKPSQGT